MSEVLPFCSDKLITMFAPQNAGKIDRVIDRMAHLDVSQVNLLLNMVDFARIGNDFDGKSDWDTSVESRKNQLEFILSTSDNPVQVVAQWSEAIRNLSQAPADETSVASDERLFLFASHLSINQAFVQDVSDGLSRNWNINMFVAHHDIKVGDDWVKDIESALSSCDGGVVFLADTARFKQSDWCSQEIGWLLGRFDDCVLTLRFYHDGKYQDPWGFLGRHQGSAVSDNSPEAAANIIVNWCISRDKLQDRLANSLVQAFGKVMTWSQRDSVFSKLKHLTRLNKAQVQVFLTAMRDNDQAWGGEDRTDPQSPIALYPLLDFIIRQPGFDDDGNRELLKEAAEQNQYVPEVKQKIDLWKPIF